jgi:16S rRNA (adenine(1408)-N(1))-methyltransferase
MAETSRRAARKPTKGGRSNALFVVASAEQPPAELVGRADRIDIVLPWGSLLRGTLALEPAAARGIVSLLRPGGTAAAFVSVADRDAVDVPRLREDSCPEIAARWSAFGACLAGFRRASAEEVAATGSTWAKRLAGDAARAVWRLEIRRPAEDESVADAI